MLLSPSSRGEKGVDLDDAVLEKIGKALGQIPSGLFIMTASHDDRRTGMLASWVQQVCFKPPMVSVAVAKGRPIMPLLSESRQFGLCQLPVDDRLYLRKFAKGVDLSEDPFLSYDLIEDTVLGVPLLSGCAAYLECELTCHMDVEGDHDIFIGKVHAGDIQQGDPMVHLRDSGLSY